MPTETQKSAGGTGQDALSSSSEIKRDHATGLPTQFLDGAAGVMYTSFLGLILDDLIALGTGKYKKC